jgi:hypothetical protein
MPGAKTRSAEFLFRLNYLQKRIPFKQQVSQVTHKVTPNVMWVLNFCAKVNKKGMSERLAYRVILRKVCVHVEQLFKCMYALRYFLQPYI